MVALKMRDWGSSAEVLVGVKDKMARETVLPKNCFLNRPLF